MFSYTELRERYPVFTYAGYDIDDRTDDIKLTYHFSIDGLAEFSPEWVFSKGSRHIDADADEVFREMVFSLGMVELISYWKTACPPTVVIKNAALGSDRLEWWKSLYFNGLGEFFYTNGIEENKDDFMTIRPELGIPSGLPSLNSEADVKSALRRQTAGIKSMGAGARCMVPIGGGKDSAVSLEVLEAYNPSIYAYIINPRGAALSTVEASGIGRDERRIISARRTLDKNMLELNKRGFLNGHTPFSAIVAFSATIAAYMNDITYIALSNESSANESTVPGSTINHQYSKSFQFERDFHEYEALCIGSGTYYFSLLRPLSEFQIAAVFAECTKYHGIFKSCNVGSKQDIWCGHCPKCLFVWLILSPFLTQQQLISIFGVNMAEDKTMRECFDKLIGIAPEKPFECVGSVNEVNAAVTLAIRSMKEKNDKLPYLFEYYLATGLYEKNLHGCERYFEYYDEENLLPEDFEAALKGKLKEKIKRTIKQ